MGRLAAVVFCFLAADAEEKGRGAALRASCGVRTDRENETQLDTFECTVKRESQATAEREEGRKEGVTATRRKEN